MLRLGGLQVVAKDPCLVQTGPLYMDIGVVISSITSPRFTEANEFEDNFLNGQKPLLEINCPNLSDFPKCCMFVRPLYGRWNRPFLPRTTLSSSKEDLANDSWHCPFLVMDDPYGRIGDVLIFRYPIKGYFDHLLDSKGILTIFQVTRAFMSSFSFRVISVNFQGSEVFW